MKNNFFKEGMKASIVSIVGNVFLSIFKLLAGIFGKSTAMISDSIHSISDVLSTVIVMIGLKLANKKEDEKHPYGHERMECIASLLLAIFLFVTGVGIGINGIKIILFSKHSEIITPTLLALIASFISIITKECMYWYTRSISKKIKSDALMADAWHHRSDSLSSIGSGIGIGGAMLGFKLLDSIASIIICMFIIKVSYDIFMDSVNKIVDRSCSNKFIEELTKLILKIDGVVEIDSIKTRLFGNRIYIDLEISAFENLSLKQAHEIAQNVHDNIENTYEDVKHCMVHVNPKSC